MEQAVNQFNKGLLSDTHPMVLGNDTLSDALNATFVTMNGNEVVLLNDMGNRRVDNAFLPSGFEPVGMKEYGGIIYVASYNPITNRSLIGSFPSPERKINSLDDKSLGNQFNFFDSFYTLVGDNAYERRFITSDTVMIPLTGETSLHAGDKFIIYSDEIENWKDYLSNYNNIFSEDYNKLVYSPKNKHITLYVGVLNSLNLFVDITKTLKRWKDGEIMKYDDSYSDEYIFNDGYFINNSSFEGDSSSYTIDDRQLIKERQIKPANTYAYKLIGPLYLKAQLNHILEFSFNITGDKNITTIDLIITADIIYNCPDGSTDGNEYIENYRYDGCGQITKIELYNGYNRHIFDFYIKNGDNYKKVQNINYLYSKPTYSNGIYKNTVTAKLTIDNNFDNNILKYFIGVDSGIPLLFISDNQSYYIETLSLYGELDLSKLNSGYVGLKAFRFFNSNRSTTITYVTETYPKTGLNFTDFRIKLENVENSEDTRIISVSDVLPNGKGIISFDLEEDRKLYKVYFLYKDNGLDCEISETRWLLTTQLFNDCYNPNSSNFVEDYLEKIYAPGDANIINSEYNEILYNKLKLDFEIINNSEIINSKNGTTEFEGGLIGKKHTNYSEDYLNYITIDSYTIKQLLNDYIDIANKELYPEINLKNNTLNISDDIEIDKSNLEIEYIQNGKILSEINDAKFSDLITTETNINGNVLNLTLKCKNKLFSKDEGDCDKSVNNGFYKLNSDKFKYDVLKNSISNTGFCISNLDVTGKDYHWFGLIFDKQTCSFPMRASSDFDRFARKYFNDHNDDNQLHLDFNDSRIKELYSMMNDIPSKNTFAFIFSAINMAGGYEGDNNMSSLPLAYVSNILTDGWAGIRSTNNEFSGKNKGYCPITCCKVWWRNGIADEWVLLNNENGLFGGNSVDDSYKFPMSIDQNYIYVGNKKMMWSCNHYKDLEKYEDLYGNDDTYLTNNDKFDVSGIINNDDDDNPDGEGPNTLEIFGNIRNTVLNQITNFLDPNKKVVYNMYKTTTLSEHKLRTIDKNNYTYNKPYSGNIIINIGYNVPEIEINNLLENNNKIHIIINDKILRILPFYVNNIQEELFRQVSVSVKSNEEFEDDINNIITNDVINNIYLENGVFRDINYKQLSGDTIYKITDKGLLKPLTNPPYKVYKDTGLNVNSLVSISNYTGSSVSLSLYLRVMGDKDSITSLKFAGGNLRTVEYTKFQNLS